MRTAKITEPISGDKAYQIRARAALPLLVRQARAGVPVFYSDLAEEMGMPNPRNLNYVLGCIGQSLERLSKRWEVKIPPLQCLVINKKTGLPGEGIGWFLVKKEDYSSLPLRQKHLIVKAELAHVFSFSRWDEVLEVLALEPVAYDFSPILKKASRGNGTGESKEHKFLKQYVACNPHVIGLSSRIQVGVTEYRLPSGDTLDVSFTSKVAWIAAEIKSAISAESDIVRGLFQCVKYRSVMDAVLLAEELPQVARAILVLGAKFPKSLIPLRNLLGIDVIDNIAPQANDHKYNHTHATDTVKE